MGFGSQKENTFTKEYTKNVFELLTMVVSQSNWVIFLSLDLQEKLT